MTGITRWVSLLLQAKMERSSITQLSCSDNTGTWWLHSTQWWGRPFAFLVISGLSFSTPDYIEGILFPILEMRSVKEIRHTPLPDLLLCARQHMRHITAPERGIKCSPWPLRIAVQWGNTDMYTSDSRINQAVGSTIIERLDTVKRSLGRERLYLFRESGGILIEGVWLECASYVHLLICWTPTMYPTLC